MTRSILWTMIAITVLALVGCRGEKTDDQAATWQQKAKEVAKQAAPVPAPGATETAAAGGPGGEILETMNSGGYTYLKLKTDQGEIWAAGPETPGLQPGDRVVLGGAMLMRNFQAKSLDRTFAEIYFAGSIERPGQGGSDAAVASAHTNLVVEDAGIDFSDLTVPQGGLRIADIHDRKADLAGKTILFRGKVVKYTPAVMGRNWLHVQDGSAKGAAGDITVTSSTEVKVGQTVLVRGTLAVDKDFGAGYRYDVIVEDAEVTVE